jgi:hypothetical protein
MIRGYCVERGWGAASVRLQIFGVGCVLAICRRSLAGVVGGAVLGGVCGYGDTAAATGGVRWGYLNSPNLQISKMEKWIFGYFE